MVNQACHRLRVHLYLPSCFLYFTTANTLLRTAAHTHAGPAVSVRTRGNIMQYEDCGTDPELDSTVSAKRVQILAPVQVSEDGTLKRSIKSSDDKETSYFFDKLPKELIAASFILNNY